MLPSTVDIRGSLSWRVCALIHRAFLGSRENCQFSILLGKIRGLKLDPSSTLIRVNISCILPLGQAKSKIGKDNDTSCQQEPKTVRGAFSISSAIFIVYIIYICFYTGSMHPRVLSKHFILLLMYLSGLQMSQVLKIWFLNIGLPTFLLCFPDPWLKQSK